MCSANFKDILMAFRASYQVNKYLTDFAVFHYCQKITVVLVAEDL